MGHRNSTFRCPYLKNRTTFHNTCYCVFHFFFVTLRRNLDYCGKIYTKLYK